jgi:hypothetical protein
VAGKNCLVRQHADASNFFRGAAIFSERILQSFLCSGRSRNAKKYEIDCKTRRLRATNRARIALRGLLTKAAG